MWYLALFSQLPDVLLLWGLKASSSHYSYAFLLWVRCLFFNSQLPHHLGAPPLTPSCRNLFPETTMLLLPASVTTLASLTWGHDPTPSDSLP